MYQCGVILILIIAESSNGGRYNDNDTEGSPIGMQYRTSGMADSDFYAYWFEKNLQGDIVAVYNESGTKLISYSYDAWGNVTQTNHNTTGTNYYATYNPFRYRGYYYDSELGLYYLQSRYYDPVVGRFISADNADLICVSKETLSDKNHYSYCDNNPISRKDEGGNAWHILIGAGVGVLSQYISDIATNIAAGKTGIDILKPNSTLVDYAAAAAGGALAATGVGVLGAVVGNAAISTVAYTANQSLAGEEITSEGMLKSAVVGGVSGLIGGSGVNGARLKGVASSAKTSLKTAVSPIKNCTIYCTNDRC